MANAMPPGVPPLQPGQQPTPQQIQAIQQQFAAEAQRQGLTPQQFAEKLRGQMQEQMKAQQQQGGQSQGGGQQQQQQQQGPPKPPQQMQMQQQQQQQQQVPIQPGPPKPEALAVAKFLKSQELKSRPCILQEKRREMFKVKRAIRALQSPAYAQARSKNPVLPEVKDRASAENTFKLLPLSMLAIRVTRLENDKPVKKTGPQGIKKAPVWNVRVEPQQDAADPYYYVWFYEGSQWRQKAYAAAALLAVVAVVLFPLWPFWARKGVWYLSMGCLGLVAAFFGLAIVRLIIFLVTVAAGPKPGIWIYPNLFEDVGFFDSFKPAWAWRETKESMAVKKAEKKAKKQAKKDKKTAKGGGANGTVKKPEGAAAASAPAEGTGKGESKGASATGVQASEGSVGKRNLSASVEEAAEEEE